MSQVLNIMYIFMHLCDKSQYLQSVTYIMTCTGFVFGFGDYPLSVGLLNLSIYIFSPGVNAISDLQSCILLYDSVRWCKCTLELILQVLNYVIHSWVYM